MEKATRLRWGLGVLLSVVLATAGFSGLTWHRLRQLEARLRELASAVDRIEAVQSDYEGPLSVSPLLLDFQLDLPGRGEVFPAMATAGSHEGWPLAVLRITNTADWPSAQTIRAEIPGWSRPMAESRIIGAHGETELDIRPELLPHAFQNAEIREARLDISATGPDGTSLFAESRTVLIHGGSEIYWGRKFANAQVAARWVTPHDPSVLELVSRARTFAPRGRMAGYSSATGDSVAIAHHVATQAKAVFEAMRASGISYVNSLFVMGDYVGEAQRVRLPAETLRLSSANCMDVSVVFASAMENLGMEPVLTLVPGHAIVGVRLGSGAQDILYLDLTVLPDGSFDAAEKRGRSWIAKTPEGEQLVIDVSAARVMGLYPLEDFGPRLPTG